MKKKIIIIMSIFVLSFIIYNLFIAYVGYSYGTTDDELLIHEKDLAYYNSIEKIVKKSKTDEIDFKEIFEFDWDRGYIAQKSNLVEDEKFCESIDQNKEIAYDEKDGLKFIVFLKGDKIVYDYVYIFNNISFMPEGEFFTRENAIFEIIQEKTWFHKQIILKLKN